MSSPDIRLIAVDMDGTLLDGDGQVPDGLWPLLERLDERGIAFVPASGRQLATLRRSFAAASADLSYIAENGAHVVHGGEEVAAAALDDGLVRAVVQRLRRLAERIDLGVVVCGTTSAYIERTDPAFRAEAERYYAALTDVDDVLAVDDRIVKVAVYSFTMPGEQVAPELAEFAETHQVVVSGEHWVDILDRGVNKGVALERLQAALGIDRSQTAVFGDYLNDLELMDAAEWSFAMENAHPDVVARANHRAPSNLDHGVVTTLEDLLFS